MRPYMGVFLILFCLYSPSHAAEDKAGIDKKAPPAPAADTRGEPSSAPATAPQTNAATGIKPEEETYMYESSSRRDPFYSLISAAKLAEKKRKRSGSPLEEYDISEIKLVAIVADVTKALNKYALVKLPSGKHYTLREGTHIGVRNGKIVKINPDEVVVQETTNDFRGREFSKVVTLKLREQEE